LANLLGIRPAGQRGPIPPVSSKLSIPRTTSYRGRQPPTILLDRLPLKPLPPPFCVPSAMCPLREAVWHDQDNLTWLLIILGVLLAIRLLVLVLAETDLFFDEAQYWS
jgi:hypothetical protein